VEVLIVSPVLAAAGYSLIYLLMGGGLGRRCPNLCRFEDAREVTPADPKRAPPPYSAFLRRPTNAAATLQLPQHFTLDR